MKNITLAVAGVWACSFLAGYASAGEQNIKDHYKTVINRVPHTVEVCTEGNGKSDLDNFITGALIGGAIGNNVPGEKGGGALGAILGGALNTERNKSPQCKTETRYTEITEDVYSHSTITFWSEGKKYTLKFRR